MSEEVKERVRERERERIEEATLLPKERKLPGCSVPVGLSA